MIPQLRTTPTTRLLMIIPTMRPRIPRKSGTTAPSIRMRSTRIPPARPITKSRQMTLLTQMRQSPTTRMTSIRRTVRTTARAQTTAKARTTRTAPITATLHRPRRLLTLTCWPPSSTMKREISPLKERSLSARSYSTVCTRACSRTPSAKCSTRADSSRRPASLRERSRAAFRLTATTQPTRHWQETIPREDACISTPPTVQAFISGPTGSTDGSVMIEISKKLPKEKALRNSPAQGFFISDVSIYCISSFISQAYTSWLFSFQLRQMALACCSSGTEIFRLISSRRFSRTVHSAVYSPFVIR